VAAQGSSNTAQRILDIAERLVQTQGFNGFSYADIAAELNTTKASLHYHFPTKAVLGTELVARYSRNFQTALEAIEKKESDPLQRLRDYVALYARVLEKDRMCLCGMLASDYSTLPKPMREEVRRFFDGNEAWLARLLEEGRKAHKLRFNGAAGEEARALIGAFEGAMLIARSYDDPSRFESAANRVLARLGEG